MVCVLQISISHFLDTFTRLLIRKWWVLPSHWNVWQENKLLNFSPYYRRTNPISIKAVEAKHEHHLQKKHAFHIFAAHLILECEWCMSWAGGRQHQECWEWMDMSATLWYHLTHVSNCKDCICLSKHECYRNLNNETPYSHIWLCEEFWAFVVVDNYTFKW